MPALRIAVLAFLSFLAVPLRAFPAENGPVALDFSPIAPSAASAGEKLAPMDLSFGIYPMSVLGIMSAIKRYDGTTRLDDGPIAYAIVAIRDWERRYPNDPWVARELLAMQHVYKHARTSEGERYAHEIAKWLQADYAATKFAHESRSEIR
jgi:hypothetical protein